MLNLKIIAFHDTCNTTGIYIGCNKTNLLNNIPTKNYSNIPISTVNNKGIL